MTGYEDGRERPTRAKANHNHAPGEVHAQSLLQQDPIDGGGGGGGGGGIIYANQSVGPYVFVSSLGKGLDGGVANPNQYILDLKIAKGSSPIAGPMDGYTKIDADLNSGAGGKYIYLCFTRNNDKVPIYSDCEKTKDWSVLTPVADVRVIAWRTLSISSYPQGFCPIWTPNGTFQYDFKEPDLNDGSGGRYIYSYQSKASTPTPIKEMGIVAGNNDQIQPPAGWVRVGDDLNAGAGGDYTITAISDRGMDTNSRIRVLCLIAALWLSLGNAYSQIKSDTVNLASTPVNHKFAVGVRFSTFSDKENSLSGKYFLTPTSALHLTIGKYVAGSGRLSTTLIYERYHSLFHTKQLRYLYGIGLNAHGAETGREFRLEDIRIYAAVTLGAEYSFKTLPLSISVDGRQLVWLRQSSDPTGSANIAISVHYLFK